MADNEGEAEPKPGDVTGRRSTSGSQRRKATPITIDLAASSVRLENPPASAPDATGETSSVASEPSVASAPETVPAPEAVVPGPMEATSEAASTTAAVEAPATASEPMKAEEAHSQAPANSFADAEALADAEKLADAKPQRDHQSTQTDIPGNRSPRPQLIAAAVVGGAIGIVATYGLALVGLWPGQGNGAMTAQVAALEARLSATEAKVGPSGQLATELDHLKSLPSIPGVTIADVGKILDPFTAKTNAAVAHMDDIDRKIAGEQAIVRGEAKAMQDALTTRMTALDTTVSGSAAQTTKLKDDVAKLQQDLAGLDKKTADALGAAQGELSGTIQALSARVADLDTRTAADFAILRGTGHATDTKIAEVGKSIAEAKTDAEAIHKTLAEQTDVLNKLQAQLQPIDDMRKAIDGLGGRIGAVDDVKKILEQQTTKLNTADDAKKAADGVAASLWIIDQRMSNIQAKLTELDTLKASVAGDGKQISALETRITPMEMKVAGLDGYAKVGLDARKDAVAAVAIANLKSAADSGRPFGPELAATKAIAGGMVDLTSLEPYAVKGLVPEAKLIEGFDPVARRILDATAPVAANDGIFGVLLSHATSSVKVMPVNAEAGDTVGARISRINTKLAGHELAGALAEWQALPDAGRQASTDWGDALKAHVEGAKAVAKLSDQAMTKLTSASQ